MIALWILVLQSPAEGVGVDQRLDARLDPGLAFVDDAGRPLRLGELLGPRPLLLVPVYYRCPRLCAQVLNGLASALKPLSLAPGVDFDVLAFTIDPGEGPERAAAAKAAVLERYGRPETSAGWRFLSGDARPLAEAIGFRYRRTPDGEFAHAAAVVVLTPDGRVARYFLGLEPPSRDLRLALVEASEGRIGGLADRVALLCLRWDPASGRYSFAALGAARIGGAATALVLAAWILRSLRRERRR